MHESAVMQRNLNSTKESQHVGLRYENLPVQKTQLPINSLEKSGSARDDPGHLQTSEAFLSD